jgi:hypothetical protein
MKTLVKIFGLLIAAHVITACGGGGSSSASTSSPASGGQFQSPPSNAVAVTPKN